jgi:hypothetical protein
MNKKAILTSYEILCATQRSLPITEYLELEDHPDPKYKYTLAAVKIKKIKIKYGKLNITPG